MSIEQHIEELRAEFLACTSRGERRQIERELKAAKAELRAGYAGRLEPG